jgi:hypothetical protein
MCYVSYQQMKLCVKEARSASRASWQCDSLSAPLLKALRKHSRMAIAEARKWRRNAGSLAA